MQYMIVRLIEAILIRLVVMKYNPCPRNNSLTCIIWKITEERERGMQDKGLGTKTDNRNYKKEVAEV